MPSASTSVFATVWKDRVPNSVKKVDKKKHIAFIVDRSGDILAIGSNILKGSENYHAEEDVIRDLLFKISIGLLKERNCRRLTMYVFRVTSKGLRMSRPCVNCSSLLKTYELWFTKVIYSTNQDRLQEERVRDL